MYSYFMQGRLQMNSEIIPTRYVPTCCNCHREHEEANCEIFFTNTAVSGKWWVIGYSGKRSKHDFFLTFKQEESMQKYIEDYIKNILGVKVYKKERKEKQKKMAEGVTVNVGDLFYNSWGYEQTNVDFYQVVSVKSKTAVLRRINGKQVGNSAGSSMSCDVSPVKDSFIEGCREETITKRIKSYDGKPCFSMECGSLHPTTENSKHYNSWYA